MCSGDGDRDLPGVSWAAGEWGGVRKGDVLVTKDLASGTQVEPPPPLAGALLALGQTLGQVAHRCHSLEAAQCCWELG